MLKALESSFSRYGLVGISAVLVDFLVFQVALLALPENTSFPALHPEQIANALGMAVGFFYSFVLHRNWSFRSSGNARRQLVLSLILLGMNVILGGLILTFLIRNLGIDAAFAKLILQAMVVVWNYLIFRHLIYT